MQLEMSRSEKKGLFSKKYNLKAHVILSDDERSLLKRHKLSDFELFNAEEQWGHPHVFMVTAGGYISKGPSDFTCESIDHLAILESQLQENCRTLARTLKSLDGAFDGGARTISFDDD